MNISRYFLCFVFYSFIGWVYESCYYTLRHKKPVNTGFLYGCLCPIYGIGALLDVALLGKLENPWQIFIAGMLLTGTLEYFVSWLLEEIFQTRWWDYSEWPFNINGRVCLLAALAFGTMGVFLIKFLHPATTHYLMSMNDQTVNLICGALILIILSDLVITVRNSESFEEKLWFVPLHKGTVIREVHKRSRISELIKRIADYINWR